MKEIDGPGAERYGAGPFTAQVVCTWQGSGEPIGVPLDNDGLVQLTADNGYTATVGDLPTGAECQVTETAAGGATSSQVVPEDGIVTIGAEPAVVTLTNTFEVTSLQVTKVIDGEVPAEATFDVTLVCTWAVDGEQREVTIPGGAVRQLQAPDELTAVYEDLPIGADCTLTETQTGSADSTTITIGDQTTEGTSAELVLAAEGTSVTVTNVFDPVDPPADPADPADPPAGGDPLPGTGADALPLVAGAVLLLLLGGVLLVVRRRRGEH